MPSEPLFPEDDLRRAWARALRYPNAPVPGHEDPRVVRLPGDVVATVNLDEQEDGRFARVTVRRTGRPVTHEEAVPLVAGVFLVGRFEPFRVDSVVGADGETLHYVIDVEAYKEHRAKELVERVRAEGVPEEEAEIAAMARACPVEELARTWDLEKVRAKDERTMRYLSDRFLVPRRWIEFQADFFLAELEEKPS